jgi:beta-glucanase (GH16 family)
MRSIPASLAILLASAFLGCVSQPHLPGWKLVWSDEFNYKGLPDPAKWGYEVGFVRNREPQFYTKARLENARVDGRNLVIEFRKDNFQGHLYSSASLTTRRKASWTYGRIEVTAKLPSGRGIWPAIWTLGNTGGWPAGGEIDIMEHWGSRPNEIAVHVHTASEREGLHKPNPAKSLTVDDIYQKFHVYAVEWFPDHMDFFVDDNKYFTFKKEDSLGALQWPFDKPQYLILNVAAESSGADDAVLPQSMKIDYVRVYQKQ